MEIESGFTVREQPMQRPGSKRNCDPIRCDMVNGTDQRGLLRSRNKDVLPSVFVDKTKGDF